MLPGIDGIELLRRMKSSPELDSIPVVMATAKGTEYDKIRGSTWARITISQSLSA